MAKPCAQDLPESMCGRVDPDGGTRHGRRLATAQRQVAQGRSRILAEHEGGGVVIFTLAIFYCFQAWPGRARG